MLYMTALGDEAEEANLTVGARIGNILRRIWDGFLSRIQSEAEAETEETAETEITDEIEETEETKETEETEETEETKETEETEAAAQDRILEGVEMEKYLIELDSEIGKIHLSGNVTIGMMLTKIADRYSDLVHYLDKSDDSNPIKAFCNIHEGVDNFKNLLTERGNAV